MKNTVIVHYHSQHGNYFDYSLWKWIDFHEGTDSQFSGFDSFGLVGNLTIDSPFFLEHIYVIVKNHNWSIKTRDFRIQRNSGIPKTEVWIVEGDDTLYYSHQAAITSHYYSHRDSHAFDMAMNYQYFDYQWGFQGWLGYQYQKEKTEFRLWGPTAAKVDLIFYQTTDDKSSIDYIVPMERGDIINLDNHLYNTHGVWFASIEHDLDYQAYAYRVYYRDKIFQDTRDPYSIATTANGRRSVILAQEHLNPKGFSVKQGKEAYWRLDNPNQAVITELHVRDFSKSSTSGVAELYRGKFLGVCQSGTHNSYGDETGFDYLKKLYKNDPSLLPNLTEDDITIGLYKFNKIYTTGNLKYEKNYK